MVDAPFQAAGATFAAIVAGLAPGAVQVGAPVEAPMPSLRETGARETNARETLHSVAARMTAAAPFSASQPELPFEE